MASKLFALDVALVSVCEERAGAVLSSVETQRGVMVQTAKMRAHKVKLFWDKTLGPVEFTVPRLDRPRFELWKAIRDGSVERGPVGVSVKDGQFRLTIPYQEKAS